MSRNFGRSATCKPINTLTQEQSILWKRFSLTACELPFHQQACVFLEGSLDRSLLRAAVTDVARATARLSEVFVESPDGALSKQRGDGLPFWREVDLRLQPFLDPQQRTAELAKEEAALPFTLSTGPLWRICLVRVTEAQHFLCVTMHQLLCSSVNRLEDWLAQILERYVSLLEPTRAAPDSPDSLDAATDADSALEGLAPLGSVPVVLPSAADAKIPALPFLRPPGDLPAFSAASETHRLPSKVVDALEHYSAQQHIDGTVVQLAALAAVLHRYRITDTVTLAVYCHGLKGPDSPASSLDADAEVLSPDITDTLSFAELVAQIATSLPGKKDDSVSRPKELSAATRPGFYPRSRVELWPQPRQKLQPLQVVAATPAPCPLLDDLSFAIHRTPCGWELRLHYRLDLYEPAAIEQLLSHWGCLLQAALLAPKTAIGALPLLRAQEMQRILTEWNPQPVLAKEGEPELLHELFMAQAKKTPDATALISGGQSLSYAQLDALSNQLAHRLQDFALRPDQIVAVCMERSVELITAVLAVMKAGAAFLPLDPTYPQERLDFMMQDSGAVLRLTHSRNQARLAAPSNQPTLCIDIVTKELGGHPSTPPPCTARSGNLAYVIYTSGSTGKPKGVVKRN